MFNFAEADDNSTPLSAKVHFPLDGVWHFNDTTRINYADQGQR